MDTNHLLLSARDLQIWNYVGINAILMFVGLLLIWALICKLPLSKSKLATPPGPVGLPVVGYLPFLGNKPHITMLELRKKYGDIIGLYIGKKYTVVLNEYTAAKEVLTHPDALDRPLHILHHLPVAGFGSLNGEDWQTQRKFYFSAAKELGMSKGQWESQIMEEVQDFMKTLQCSRGNPTDISRSLKLSVCNNVVSLLVGRSLNHKEVVEKAQIFLDYTGVAFNFVGPSRIVAFIPSLYKFFVYFKIFGYHKAAKTIKEFSTFIREEIFRHKTSEEFREVHDYMNIYLKKISQLDFSAKEKNSFTENILEGNVTHLFLGATDTIFSSIGWLLRLMSKHQDIQNKVHSELIETYGQEMSAKYEERDRIPYTFAVMMEAQRFSSISPFSLSRRAKEDIPIRGYIIPKGSEILNNLWLMHRDPNYWKEPDVFRPERFLSEDGTKLIKNTPSYAPFSLGRRNCPGEVTAWMEILAYFTEIVKKFEVSAPPGVEPDFSVVGGGLVTELTPQPLCFKERSE